MRVFTSERTARFRAERRTPARACFFAEAVRLATRHYQGESTHEFRIIGADGIRASWTAPQSPSRRIHRTDRCADRRCRDRGRRAGNRQKAARRLLEPLGRNHGAALPGSRGQVPSGSEADPRLIFALPARAKLNLNLEVLGRSADGFHDLRTTFQAVALHDLLEVEPAKETTFTTSGLRVSAESNSVLVAQQALESAAKRPLPARIH